MKYEELLKEIEENNLNLYECEMHEQVKGLCIGNNIVLNKELEHQNERNCILAEEIGHYKTTVGDITGGEGDSPKQELKARAYAYNTLIGLDGLIRAWDTGSKTYAEAAEYLGVTEEFLIAAVDYYTNKYGTSVIRGNKEITFLPSLKIKNL